MKNYKLIITIFISFFVSYFLIQKTNSFFLTSTEGEKVILKTTEWKPAESTPFFIKNKQKYSVEEKINSSSFSLKEVNFYTNKNQYLTFQYKVDSEENLSGFDNPNVIVKLNNRVIYKDHVIDNNWHRGYIDLESYNSNDNKYFLEFISLNTFDDFKKPKLLLKDVSTSRFLAKKNDLLKFNVSKNNALVHMKYFVENNGVLEPKKVILSSPFEFVINEHFFNSKIEYFSVDSFGNVEDSKLIFVDTDFESPKKIENIKYFVEGDSELSMRFIAPVDNFSNPLSSYEVGISSSSINEIADWSNLKKISLVNHKKFGFSNLPSKAGENENILLRHLELGKSFFTLRARDQAGNYSPNSNEIEVEIQ